MKRIVAGCAAVAAGVPLAMLPAAPAPAAGTGGSSTGGGYGASAAHVSFSGDYDPSLTASAAASAGPPLCYWAPVSEAMGWPVNSDDPKSVRKFYFKTLVPSDEGAEDAAARLSVKSEDEFDQAVKAEKNGRDVTWYALVSNPAALGPNDGSVADANASAAKLNAAGCGQGINDGPYGMKVLISLAYFPAGDPPAPRFSAYQLAEMAYNAMDLVKPTLQWNPKITAADGASLVNLATWMWVDNQKAVADRTVSATAGPVTATVTAKTDGVSITSVAGTTECSDAQASTHYAPGVADSSACELTFTRPSWGYPDGFPVQSSTVWDASWTSNTGDQGDLDAKTVGATTNIPVIESQTVDTPGQ